MKTIKKIILSNRLLREIFFFAFRKKIYKNIIDRKINRFSVKDNRCNSIKNLIVSLTSYSNRINDLKYVLYSLINQTLMPEKIVVWLSAYDFNANKSVISEIENIFHCSYLEFRITRDIRSYTKLIPALIDFPDYYIVTADDDIYYARKWLEKLWKEHKKYPDKIIAHTAHKLKFDKKNIIMPYNTWNKCVAIHKPSCFIFPAGVGGVLWQKSLLYKDILCGELFTNLCPLADDIWFYFMTILAKTQVKTVSHPYKNLLYIDIYKEYGLNNSPTLASENIGNNKNDTQFIAVQRHYNLSHDHLYNYLKSVEQIK